MWTPSSRREQVAVAAVAVLLVGVIAVGALLASAAPPTVTDVQSEWGAVTDDTTVVETQVSVDNPNPFPIPPVLSVGAEVRMNGVLVGPGDPVMTGIATGNDSVEITTALLSERIPAWWPTHVDNGESTTMTIDPQVSAPFVNPDPPNRTRTFETNMLSAFQTERARTIRLADQRLLRVAPLEAEWGDATDERTPVTVSTTLENTHEQRVAFERIEYAVRMNDVVVGNGSTGTVSVAPGETESLTLDVVIENDRLATWWPTHVAENETTNLTVETVGVVAVDGEPTEVPLHPLSPRVQFSTDLLGDGGASTDPLPAEPTADAEVPTVSGTSSEWTGVNETATRLETAATVENPNDEDALLTELLRLDAGFTVWTNGIELADGVTEGEAVPPGTSTLTVGDVIPGPTVERWWVTHINDGERTEQRVHERVTADLGFTTVEVRNRTSTRTVTTDALAGIETDERQRVTRDGRTVFVIESVSAGWGEATLETTPVETSAVVSNPTIAPVTITRIDYRVLMNDVEMADGSEQRSTVVGPGETRTVDQTVPLDTDQVDRWWVEHLADGQHSDVTVEYTVHVTAGGETETVTIDGLNSTVTTDLGG